MLDTSTFQRILAHEESHRRPTRARTAAINLWGTLTLIATFDRPSLPIPDSTLYPRLGALRAAGIAPITSPDALARLARDIEATDPENLTRLVWVLNGHHHHDQEGVRRHNRHLLAAAIALIDAPAH